MCCVSHIGLPLVAGLAVAIGAFGLASSRTIGQPEPTGAAAQPAAGSCCGAGGTATAAHCPEGAETCDDCAEATAKGPVEDPVPEAGSAHVGELAPDFALIDLEGNRHQLSEYTAEGKIVVLEWFNPECPFVVKQYERFTTMADTYATLTEEHDNIVWLAINSGREGHATADHDFNAEAFEKWEMQYPILMDPTGIVGHAYDSTHTPTMFVIAEDGTLIYAGAIDNNPSPRVQGDVNYVLQALEQHFAGETITDAETAAYGCGVKY